MLWSRIRRWGTSYLLTISKRRRMNQKSRNRQRMIRKMCTPFSLCFLVLLKSAKRFDQSSTRQFRRRNFPNKSSTYSKTQPPASSSTNVCPISLPSWSTALMKSSKRTCKNSSSIILKLTHLTSQAGCLTLAKCNLKANKSFKSWFTANIKTSRCAKEQECGGLETATAPSRRRQTCETCTI